MAPHLARVLRKRYQRLEAEGRRPSENDVLVEPWTGSRWTLAAAGVRAIGRRVNATVLRHTAGTWLASKLGLSPAVMRFLGHKSLDMAQRVYAHATQADLDHTAEVFEQIELAGEQPVELGSGLLSIFTRPEEKLAA
jgi:integrase